MNDLVFLRRFRLFLGQCVHDRLHKVVCPRERHFGSVVGASGTLIVLGGRDGSATPMALGNHKVFQEKCKKSFYYIFCTQ